MPKNPSLLRAEPTTAPSVRGGFVFAPQHGWLLLILAVAAYLRAGQLGLLEFKADEANAAILAVKMAHFESFPQIGLTYSVGVKQAPLFIYLLAPFFAISRAPAFFTFAYGLISTGAVWLCYWIGRRYFNVKIGLMAAAMFAVSPWAVVFSRKIWPQDFLPVICTVLLWLWCQLLIDGKTKQIFWIVLLSLAAWQIHLTASNLLALIGVLWLVCRFPLDWRRIGLGIGINVLLLLPYVHYQMQHDWEDFHKAAAVVTTASQSEVYTIEGIHPQWGFPLASRDQTGHLLNIVSGGGIEDILGLSTQAFLAGDGLIRMVIKLVKLIFIVAVVAAGVSVVRKGQVSARPPWIDLGQEPRLAILWLWVIMPVLFFGVSGLRTYLSYFALVMPVAFLLIAWAIDAGQRRVSWRIAKPVLWLLFGLIVAGELTYTYRLYDFLDRQGGAWGTYGVVYRHKVDLCNRIAETANTPSPVMSRDWPPKTPVENDIQYMVANRLEHKIFLRTTAPQTGFVVVDMRFRPPNEPEPSLGVTPLVFGPLRLYEIPLNSQRAQ